MKKVTVKEAFSIPNILSYFRILLVPVFVWAYYTAVTEQSCFYYIVAAVVIGVSGLTDFLDGQIARRCNMITEWGKFIDPVADKLTQGALVICMAALRYPLMWILVGLFVLKEGFLSVAGIVLIKHGKKLNGALWYGKICTATFYACVLILLVFTKIDEFSADIIILVCGALMAFALIMYANVYCKIWHDLKHPNEPKKITDSKIVTDIPPEEIPQKK